MKEKCNLYFLTFIWTYKKTFRFAIFQLSIVFNHPIFDIRNAYFHRRNSVMNMLGKNTGFYLSVIIKQVDTQRISFDWIKNWLYVKNEQNRS